MAAGRPRIGILTTGLTGMMYACLEVGRRLESAGYHIVYFGGKRACERATVYNFETSLIKQIDPYLSKQSYHEIGYVKRIGAKLLGKKSRISDDLITALELEDFIARVKEAKLDLLLVDIEMHEFIIPLCSHDIRIVLISQWYQGIRTEGLPPLTSLASPKQDSTSNFDGEWNTYLGTRKGKKLKSRMSVRRADTIHRIAEKYQFDLDEQVNPEAWPPPFGYKRIPVISLTAREMEFPHTPPDNFSYAGPMILIKGGSLHAEMPTQLTL